MHTLKGMLLSAALATMVLPVAAQNSATSTPAAEPAQKKETVFRERQENQQARIKQGAKSGELTKGEAMRVERQHRHLNREARHMRAENGGKLTAADKAKLNHQQNVESHHIYRAKHNQRTRGN